ncbi:hypothetical protein Q3G72_021581 [Acer saccharum]|nr:hypothetical protein Q3G72_021581 [Acer saccharum]
MGETTSIAFSLDILTVEVVASSIFSNLDSLLLRLFQMLWIQVYFMFVRSQIAESKHARKPMFTCEFCCLPSSDLVLTKSTPYSEVGDLVSDILEFVEAFIPSLKFEF